jgi:hypothetical protein
MCTAAVPDSGTTQQAGGSDAAHPASSATPVISIACADNGKQLLSLLPV